MPSVPIDVALTAAQGLHLVADVAAALAAEHSDAGVIRALGTALSRHVPWCSLEVGERHGADDEAECAWLHAGAADIARTRVPWADTLAARARVEGSLWITGLRRVTRSPSPIPPEVARAIGAGAVALLVLPLGERSERVLYAAIGFSSAVDLGDATQRALAGLLGGAVHHARLVARVAAVSRRAHAEREYLRGELVRRADGSEIVVASPAMRRLLDESVALVARHDTTVLLRGESGVGKEVIARRIHALSPRASRPMLAVNCGALPETLAESALFGHERGAFTGATHRHAGLFERAHGGTLLLDEVAELTAAMQVKLLRVLQEGEFERVGGGAAVRVNVRVIAATHRPLERMVAAGTFRADLFYRLAVFPIEIPPLRERPEDVAALAHALIARLSRRHGRSQPPALSARSLARLVAHDWPGNVRELENVLERALLLSPGGVLQLPATFGRSGSTAVDSSPDVAGVPRFADAARAAIERALAECAGRIHGPDGAAEKLGLRPTTLQSKIKKLRIDRTRFTRA